MREIRAENCFGPYLRAPLEGRGPDESSRPSDLAPLRKGVALERRRRAADDSRVGYVSHPAASMCAADPLSFDKERRQVQVNLEPLSRRVAA